MAKRSDEHAKAYFEAAVSYRAAADQLLAIIEAKGSTERLPLRDPTYFLYAHAVELALKACLLSRDLQIEHGHAISDYYVKCRTAELIGTKDPHYEMHNLVALLDAGNELPLHRYRYPGKSTKIIPTLGWAREVVGQLMEAVEPHVDAWVKSHPSVPEQTKNRIAFGKPTHTRQPVPAKKGP